MLEDPTQSPPAASIMPWPLSGVWLGDHLARDYARFWSSMAGVTDPVEALQAETGLGANLLRDWTIAMVQMWELPLKVWMAGMPMDADRSTNHTLSSPQI